MTRGLRPELGSSFREIMRKRYHVYFFPSAKVISNGAGGIHNDNKMNRYPSLVNIPRSLKESLNRRTKSHSDESGHSEGRRSAKDKHLYQVTQTVKTLMSDSGWNPAYTRLGRGGTE